MKSVKMACVHPAALQLFQKLVELMLGSGSDGSAAGEEMVAGGAGEMAGLVHGGELKRLQGLELSGEGGGPAVC